MSKQLRPYQQQVLDRLLNRLRTNHEPTLVNASVGAGKSLIIAELLKVIEKAGWRALCLTMNSSLIQQNAKTYELQGFKPGIFCSGLNKTDYENNVIYASPHSIVSAIKKKLPISEIFFNLIVIDEAHNINYLDNDTMYMRLINHYKLIARMQPDLKDVARFRIVGLTGTPFRMKGKKTESIVASSEELESISSDIKYKTEGVHKFFKDEVCSISTAWLIAHDYLVEPIYGKTSAGSYDMRNVRIDNNGKFNTSDLQKVVDANLRLTSDIMEEIIYIVENERNGAFIFASTVKHAIECMRSLPPNESACVTGKTTHEEREKILSRARRGEIKYLVNVATLLVGIDVPNFDVCAWLRPTESLTLYTQGIGRVLRLSPDKKNALILDYAGNVERHENAIIDGQFSKVYMEDLALFILGAGDEDMVLECPKCETMNKETARRCRNIDKKERKRCDHYFKVKKCSDPDCKVPNDITARHCRGCGAEIIDPNDKLAKQRQHHLLDVFEASYWITEHKGGSPTVNVKYITHKGLVYENIYLSSERSRFYFYGTFVKKHLDEPQRFVNELDDDDVIHDIIYNNELKTPRKLLCKKNDAEQFIIVEKQF